MKKKIEDNDEPIGSLKAVKDFLPPPDKLILKERNIKVTINLKESSVGYFKELADKYHTPYQKIIRNVLDHYATNISNSKLQKV